MRIFHYLGVGAAMVLACTSAQADTGPSTSTQGLAGPLVNGVCLLSRQAVFANAKVGKAASSRLQQLATGAQNRFDTERAKLGDDVHAFQQQAPSLPEASRQTQAQALEQRARALDAERQRDVQQLELTRAQAMAQIGRETQPMLVDLYKAKGCGLLLDRNAVLGGNFGNDLTGALIEALDHRITTISFNLAPLPAAAAAPGHG